MGWNVPTESAILEEWSGPKEIYLSGCFSDILFQVVYTGAIRRDVASRADSRYRVAQWSLGIFVPPLGFLIRGGLNLAEGYRSPTQLPQTKLPGRK